MAVDFFFNLIHRKKEEKAHGKGLRGNGSRSGAKKGRGEMSATDERVMESKGKTVEEAIFSRPCQDGSGH